MSDQETEKFVVSKDDFELLNCVKSDMVVCVFINKYICHKNGGFCIDETVFLSLKSAQQFMANEIIKHTSNKYFSCDSCYCRIIDFNEDFCKNCDYCKNMMELQSVENNDNDKDEVTFDCDFGDTESKYHCDRCLKNINYILSDEACNKSGEFFCDNSDMEESFQVIGLSFIENATEIGDNIGSFSIRV